MAGFNIHFAVGKRYTEKNKNVNAEELTDGNIDPDLKRDKVKSHYTIPSPVEDLETHLKNKIHLEMFLNENSLDSDFKKGQFLHLVTDFLFFNAFFDKEYIKTVSYADFCKSLYHSYDLTNQHVKEKYQIDYGKYTPLLSGMVEKTRVVRNLSDDDEYSNILPVEKLDAFIEYVSSIDLEEYASKIMQSQQNMLP